LSNVAEAPSPFGRLAPGLAGVPETMLWTLHHRANESQRPDRVLNDPDSVRLHAAIDYDFARSFGDPSGFLAARAAAIDTVLRRWIAAHPDGVIVSLGEGLETQVHRVDNGRIHWLSVDLPDAIRLRACFLPPTERLRHIAVSALDTTWMDAVDPSDGVFIIAQGLLMYLRPDNVRHLLTAIARRFPAADIIFDTVPRWFSRLTLAGLWQTPHYRLPPMPWGIDRDAIEAEMHAWLGPAARVAFLPYGRPRGLPALMDRAISRTPVMRHVVPSLVRVSLTPTRPAVITLPVVFAGAAPTSASTDRDTIPSSPWREHMKSVNSGGTLGNVLAEATRHAGDTGDLAIAAARVVARRVELGMTAALYPVSADHAEFERMVPEKLEAFSAAGMIMLRKSTQAGFKIARLANQAVMTTARATVEMAGNPSPLAVMQAQRKMALGWFEQMSSACLEMGMLTLGAQQAAMVPIRQTVSANVKRLAR
jgi:O-methyltransferase involved in polyketide biosynthesis